MIEITGTVVHGKHFGRTIKYPTANLDRRSFVRRKQKIRQGVWAGIVVIYKGLNIKDKEYRAGIVIGPIDKYNLPKIEAHLLGFKGNLYGK